MPGVFTAPIRTDVVQFVHTNMSKNRYERSPVGIIGSYQPPDTCSVP